MKSHRRQTATQVREYKITMRDSLAIGVLRRISMDFAFCVGNKIRSSPNIFPILRPRVSNEMKFHYYIDAW